MERLVEQQLPVGMGHPVALVTFHHGSCWIAPCVAAGDGLIWACCTMTCSL
jgi:hypothetical protein